MKLVDAFEFVKTQREATDPNEGFLQQLRDFQSTSFSFEQENDEEEEDGYDSPSGKSRIKSGCQTGKAQIVKVHKMNSMPTPLPSENLNKFDSS